MPPATSCLGRPHSPGQAFTRDPVLRPPSTPSTEPCSLRNSPTSEPACRKTQFREATPPPVACGSALAGPPPATRPGRPGWRGGPPPGVRAASARPPVLDAGSGEESADPLRSSSSTAVRNSVAAWLEVAAAPTPDLGPPVAGRDRGAVAAGGRPPGGGHPSALPSSLVKVVSSRRWKPGSAVLRLAAVRSPAGRRPGNGQQRCPLGGDAADLRPVAARRRPRPGPPGRASRRRRPPAGGGRHPRPARRGGSYCAESP